MTSARSLKLAVAGLILASGICVSSSDAAAPGRKSQFPTVTANRFLTSWNTHTLTSQSQARWNNNALIIEHPNWLNPQPEPPMPPSSKGLRIPRGWNWLNPQPEPPLPLR